MQLDPEQTFASHWRAVAPCGVDRVTNGHDPPLRPLKPRSGVGAGRGASFADTRCNGRNVRSMAPQSETRLARCFHRFFRRVAIVLIAGSLTGANSPCPVLRMVIARCPSRIRMVYARRSGAGGGSKDAVLVVKSNRISRAPGMVSTAGYTCRNMRLIGPGCAYDNFGR
jgi:hypothetical protein